MRRKTAFAAGVAAAILGATPVWAISVEGVEFPARRVAEGRELVLRGAGLLRYKVFFKAYVAAFYVEAAREGPPNDTAARRIEIEYFWPIAAKDFAEATREGIARNVGEPAYVLLEERIEALGALYRDVAPGDRYSLTFIPGRGTGLAHNGRPLGVIAGEDFAEAIFSIWLGERPLDEDLKAKLLGEA